MTAVAVGGAAVGAFGQVYAGQAASNAANYNAAIQMQNAAQADRKAEIASQAGMADQNIQQLKNRAEHGSIKANQGASGVGINSGSFQDVEDSTLRLGEMDSLSIRSRATREAYGYQVEGIDFRNKAALERQEAKNAKTASYIAAGSTLLGGAADAGASWKKYQKVGAL
jgi:hypothetical protein